jgi:hypothetical protein
MEKEKPSYFSILTAKIRYDRQVRPRAKILYSEITALCNKEGYCWASNQYFANLYETDVKVISEWIKELRDLGYIKTAISKKDGNLRKIYLDTLSFENTPTYPVKTPDPYPVKTPYNNTSINIINNNDAIASSVKSKKYGNQNINELMDFLTEKVGATPDGTETDNRRFANHLIKKFQKDYPDKNPIELIKMLIEIALKDEFHAKNITTFRYLYYNAQRILNSMKGRFNRTVTI